MTPQPSPAVADAAPGNWVDRWAAPRLRPWLRLMRLDRPAGIWLLFLPCLWGAALALAVGHGGWATFARHAALFAVGAAIMRSAGCVWNDVLDRDIDAQVARTAARPVASGAISRRAAVALAAALSLAGLVVLLRFDRFTVVLGAAAVAPVAVYPLMKRIVRWPQAWLGLTFNWGALVGYAAAAGGLSPAALALYGAGVAWTLGYDTIYACQDREDDALVGVRSSARALGRHVRAGVAVFYTLCLAGFALAGGLAGFGPAYFVVLAAPAAHFVWQVRHADPDDPAACLAAFRANREAGLLLLAPLLLAAAGVGA